MFKLQRTRIQNTLFTVHISDTLVALKQSHGHQAYNDNADTKESYNYAQFERSHFNSVRGKGNDKVFFFF